MSHPRAKPAFTLVELLVVIGIIALLISVLLPVLSNAQKSSRQLKCLATLRQLGQIDALYQVDNKGYRLWAYFGWSQASGGWNPSTPPNPDADGPRRWWYQNDVIVKTMGAPNPASFRYPDKVACPDAPLSEQRANKDGVTLHNSYSMNYTSLPGMNAALAPKYFNCWKTNQIVAPAEKIQFCDGVSEGVSVSNSATNSSLRYYDPYYGPEFHEPPDKGSTVAYRHKKGANVLYYDGHGEWKRDDMLIVDPAKPESLVNLRQWQPKTK
ncbi:MAG: type II secretion system protein [Phycisphaerae bacterium]|nr:prepilin-type N-terminal cleavage/methylation domain-containing protein [Tepidisphaeraceae bacterium]